MNRDKKIIGTAIGVALLLIFTVNLTGCVELEDEEKYELTVDIEGEGTVLADDDEIEDGWSEEFEEGSNIDLEANPKEGWYFEKWTDDHTAEERTIELELEEDIHVTAHFEQMVEDQVLLTIDIEGDGATEPSSGDRTYDIGEKVNLTVVEEYHDDFIEWRGDVPEGEDELEITIVMGNDKEITAVFEEKEKEIVIKDAVGEEITFEEPPEKIISFMPSNTEILFHLEVGDRVIGVDDYSNYPEEVDELPSVGDAFETNYEKIVDLDPDVVVIPETNIQMRQQLDEYGIESVVTSGESLSDVYSDMELLGEMCGVEERAREKAEELENEMNEITNETKDLPSEKRTDVLYVSGTYDGINTPGNDTFQGTLLSNAGGNNIAYDVDGWGNIDEEDVIDRDPEVIIAPESVQPGLEEYTEKESWEEITAVEEEEIHYVDADIISRPGPRVAQAQEELVEILSPLE